MEHSDFFDFPLFKIIRRDLKVPNRFQQREKFVLSNAGRDALDDDPAQFAAPIHQGITERDALGVGRRQAGADHHFSGPDTAHDPLFAGEEILCNMLSDYVFREIEHFQKRLVAIQEISRRGHERDTGMQEIKNADVDALSDFFKRIREIKLAYRHGSLRVVSVRC